MPELQHPDPVFSPMLTGLPDLVHGFSTRLGGCSTAFAQGPAEDCGDLNLGYSAYDLPENVHENRRRWLRAIRADSGALRHALLRQEHTATVHVLRDPSEAAEDFATPGTRPGDGLLTGVPGVLLTIQTADCVPVLLCDPVRRVVGAIHAGWRGTLARIVERGVKLMREEYGTAPQDICAAIGPSIGPESYQVSDEVRQKFAAEFNGAGLCRGVRSPDGERYISLDLWEANRHQLLCAEVPSRNIEVAGMDTAADTARFFSYRAEHGRTGRMMSSIGLLA